MSLFEKYGGFGTVNSIVRNFYRDVLDTPESEHVFPQHRYGNVD